MRVELATTLDMAKDVRTYDIEAVDPAFAVACAGSIMRLLQVIEREAFQHLQVSFPEFVDSVEYIMLIASKKAFASDSVQRYIKRCIFLEDSVRYRKVVPWTDPDARGRTYVFCDNYRHNNRRKTWSYASDGDKEVIKQNINKSMILAVATKIPVISNKDTTISSDLANMEFTGLWVGDSSTKESRHEQIELITTDPTSLGHIAGLDSDDDTSPQDGEAIVLKAVNESIKGQQVLQRFLANPDVSAPVCVTFTVDPRHRSCISIIRLQVLAFSAAENGKYGGLDSIETDFSGDNTATTPIRLTVSLQYDTTSEMIQVGLALPSIKNPDDDIDCTPLLSTERIVAHTAATCDQTSNLIAKSLNISVALQSPDEQHPGDTTIEEANDDFIEDSGMETLMDLYVQYADVNRYGGASSSSGTENSTSSSDKFCTTNTSVLQRDVSGILTKRLGTCEFPLVRSICQFPTRTLLQVLLLLLTGRSVVLLGSSPSLISQLMASLPRFVWPFLLSQTHKQTQFHSSTEIENWINNKRCKTTSKNTPVSSDSTRNTLGGRNEMRRGWIIGCSHDSFHNLSDTLKYDLKLVVTDDNATVPGRWNTGMFVFDTDLGEILHDARSHREQEFDEYNNQSKKTRKNMNDLSNTNSLDMKSKLVSPFALRRLNSRSFQVLDKELRDQTKSISFLLRENNIHRDIKSSNSAIELAFARYFTNLCLRFLPQNLYHYPQQSVVSCDVRAVLGQVTSQARAQREKLDGIYVVSNKTSNLPELSDVEVEFVTELMGLGSPAFRELLQRQGQALQQLKF